MNLLIQMMEKKKKILEWKVIFIKNKMTKQIYFKLIYKDLYYYKTKEDTKHKGMHNLSGVYLKEEETQLIDGKKFYSFVIVFPAKERKYYVMDEKEYENWLKVIRYSNLIDLYK